MTNYDKLCQDNELVNRYEFLDNLEKLSRIDNNALELFNKLYNLNSEVCEIEPGIQDESKFVEEMAMYYSIHIPIIYNILNNCLDKKRYTEEESFMMIGYVHDYYLNNYNEFLIVVQKALEMQLNGYYATLIDPYHKELTKEEKLARAEYLKDHPPIIPPLK